MDVVDKVISNSERCEVRFVGGDSVVTVSDAALDRFDSAQAVAFYLPPGVTVSVSQRVHDDDSLGVPFADPRGDGRTVTLAFSTPVDAAVVSI